MDSYDELAAGDEDWPGNDLEEMPFIDSPAAIPLSTEQKLDAILMFCKEQADHFASVRMELQSMDDKLKMLLHDRSTVLKRKVSIISLSRALSKKQSTCKLDSGHDVPERSGVGSGGLGDKPNFDDLDQTLGLKVMKAARKFRARGGEGSKPTSPKSAKPMPPPTAGGFPSKTASIEEADHPDKKHSLSLLALVPLPGDPQPQAPSNCPILPSEPSGESLTQREPRAKSSGMPGRSPNGGAASLLGSTGLTQSEVSLSQLFKHRETQLIPASPEVRSKESPKLPNLAALDLHSQASDETIRMEVLPAPTPKALRVCQGLVELWMRLCGLTPLVQWKPESAEFTESPAPSPRALAASKAYHCVILLLNFLFVVLAASSVAVCSDLDASEESHTEASVMCRQPLATDLAFGVGALLAVWSCGGLGSYFKSSRMQLQIQDHLMQEVDSTGLTHQWKSQKGVDAVALGSTWLFVLAARSWIIGPELTEPMAAGKQALYALACACLLGACYVQMSMWRGISLTVVAFARSVLEGQVSNLQARQRWREAISCMRQTSRMFQLTAAVLALTTVLVCFGVLYDFDRRRHLTALPTLIVAGILPVALYVAASSTSHCTRLPSLVCMLEEDEEQEEDYMNLALFLTLSESGFFMWDTRVTLAVLQKFLYFTTAIVGTIGFQLKVFHF